MADTNKLTASRADAQVDPSLVNRLLGTLGQTWPARLAQDAWSGVTAPGDAYTGRLQVMDPATGQVTDDAIARAQHLSGVMMGGGLGGSGAEPGAVFGSALTRQARSIDELRAALAQEHPNLDYYVSQAQQAGGPVIVNKVVVPPDMRGQGVGTQFMQDVLDYADANKLPTALTPDSSFGGNKNKLTQWYKGLGFVPNKGRAADYGISESMYRLPGPQT